MKRSERTLAVGFGLSLLGWGILEAGGSLLSFGGSGEVTTQVLLQQEIQDLQLQTSRIEQAAAEFRQTRLASLPGDPGRAASLYQAWLVQQLQHSGIENATVTPAPAVPEPGVGHRIPVSIEATGTAQAIAGFVERFHATSLMHRVTSLDIMNASSGRDDEQRLSVSVEGLSMEQSESNELPQPGVLPGSLTACFSEQNPFVLERAVDVETVNPLNDGPATAEASVVPSEPVVSAQPDPELRFVASVRHGEVREAWFVETTTGASHRRSASQTLKFLDEAVVIVSVSDDEVLLEFSGRRETLRLGQSLPSTTMAQSNYGESF